MITPISLKLHRWSTILDELRIGSQSRKCYKMIEWKQQEQKLGQFEVETTKKNPRGELIDILLILKVESTSKFPHRLDAIIFTLICLSESMKSL